MEKIASYQSYIWSLGTTSFRMKNFNRNIERQLFLINEFWKLEENINERWIKNSVLQERYYDFLKENEFVDGAANNKPKDARQKTSGLVDIGLLDDNRHLTEVGKRILEISESGNYDSDNHFYIPKDSYVYLKQLLKTSTKITAVDGYVRPFVVVAYMLSQLEYLTFEEFAYLVPLCSSKEITATMIESIRDYRNGATSIDDIVVCTILSLNNYKTLLDYFLNTATLTEETFCQIGINRDSFEGDKVYYKIYNNLYDMWLSKDFSNVDGLYQSIESGPKGKVRSFWKNLFFEFAKINGKRTRIIKDNVEIFRSANEMEFRKNFFILLHKHKALATLSDYSDLNRRYLKVSDTILFDDDKVFFDVVPKVIFNKAIDKLYETAYTECSFLMENSGIEAICPELLVENSVIIEDINATFHSDCKDIEEAKELLDNEKLTRFNELIDKRFDDNTLTELLDCFETRDDDRIKEVVSDNADVPTIFEYITGIIWYKISGRKGNILKYMNLSLEANLLPRTHASGGMSDIVYEYEETPDYPKHSLLLEVSLMNAFGQKLNEDEPAARHLGKYRLESNNDYDYCTFIAPNIPLNLISSFRNKKTFEYFEEDDIENSIYGLKIIPLMTKELKNIIANKITYTELYHTFENAYQSNTRIAEWYDSCIVNQVS